MSRLYEAIQLRNEGELVKSNELLTSLVEETPGDALLNYQTAWSFDALGKESAAIPYYERALQIGLEEQDAIGALIGLGSSYRALGKYAESKEVLERGIEQFPENNALKTFYAMTLYNVGEYERAMEVLLICIAETSSDPHVVAYKKAIGFYANNLNTTW
ncbi:tetratricopeptide repeat protein [Sporosarcina sp. USHLN248]|uniref:tetratricopeptide repeat protein n=1 Tax=Sporosarcina sp. USHLN248 TaxID=3081300 RepID=UPI0030161BBC